MDRKIAVEISFRLLIAEIPFRCLQIEINRFGFARSLPENRRNVN